jgi:ribosomal protein S18 acetylase RimI-like enzyme
MSTPDAAAEPVLRQALPEDSEFCFALHKAAMGGYVAEVWGWDEQVQRGYHDRAFDPRRWHIITVGGEDVGMIDIEYRQSEIYLARIEILPAHQGRGIGTRLISALMDTAHENHVALTLDVLAVNLRARALYRRLGLRDLSDAEAGAGKIRMSTRR